MSSHRISRKPVRLSQQVDSHNEIPQEERPQSTQRISSQSTSQYHTVAPHDDASDYLPPVWQRHVSSILETEEQRRAGLLVKDNNVVDEVEIGNKERQPHPRVTPQIKSWKAPVVMVSSLLFGLAVALAHHGMNVSLNNKVVDQSGGLSQEWTSRYATGLAFIAKTAMVVCVGSAFVQRQWLNVSTNQQPIRVKDLDTLSSVLANFFSLFTSLIWFRNPLLMLIALISWTIPFAAVVSPGSLIVRSIPNPSTLLSQVPQLDFSLDKYTVLVPPSGADHQYTSHLRVAEAPVIFRKSLTAGIGHKLLTRDPLYLNSSYTFSFFGPAIQCSDANSTMNMNATVQYGVRNYPDTSFFENVISSAGLTRFVSWVPIEDDTNSYVGNNTDPEQPVLDDTEWGEDVYWGDGKGDALFVMTQMYDQNNWHRAICDTPSADGDPGYKICSVNVTECRLHNATYIANITSTNGQQQISYTISPHDPVPNPQNPGGPKMSMALRAYEGIMSSFGRLLVGREIALPSGPDNLDYVAKNLTYFDLLNVDWQRSEAVIAGLEELFQNITLSLLTEDSLLSNTTDRLLVSQIIYQNTYVYQQRTLLLAYGIAFLFTLLCCIIGLHAFFVSKKSYQNIFSTFVRAAEGSDLDMRVLLPAGDTGADPLPKDIAGKVMRMAR